MSQPVRNEKGEWVIPASRRPDGTWRKEKVLKEGYVPQDEVKAFETVASRKKAAGIPGLPPGAPPPSVSATKPKPAVSKPSASQQVTAKKDEVEEIVTKVAALPVVEAPVTQDPAAEKQKRIKAIRKKLKDIEEIETKPKEQLNTEQLEKIKRKADLQTELNLLLSEA